MGLPIFALLIALVSNTLFSIYESLHITFYFESILFLAFSIYFILYLINNGFDVKITEAVSKTFTREYLYEYLKKEILKEKKYTLILISVDNLNDINVRYGIKNGDKVLFNVANWIGEYFQSKDINNFPLGHVKGGDFVIGLKGDKNQYKIFLELMCLKASEFKVNDIEVKLSGAITDTSFSNELEYLIENLFEMQEENRNLKLASKDEEINPSELESFVIAAIEDKSFIVLTQDIFEDKKSVLKECFVKLKTKDNKIIHQKSYMKIMNKFGLMMDFDLMILEKSILECNHLSDEIFVLNISPTSLRNLQFIKVVEELLNKNPLVKNKIMFMLSESEYYSQIDKYNMTLKILKSMGIFIAIDRLGSIHTSFLYLRDLDIDVVRFDSFYTKDIINKNYKSIIDGFNVMAHEKGVKTWIKMIEDEETDEFVRKLNIDYTQGKYLADLEQNYET
ncbi:GGDEF domain-containing protein [bacterium]|nr:GGDEF domain-containing protein [bacterium]MBU1994510.1 GGDEF domain-containing protein [bacterium]